MKKYIAFVLAVACALTLAACKNNKDTLTSGSYKMVVQEEGDDRITPCFTIDMDKHSFVLSSDLLSSYLPIGTFEISDGILTATTDDGKYQYVFEIIDDETLSFIQDESSHIITISEQFAVPAYSSAQFKKLSD